MRAFCSIALGITLSLFILGSLVCIIDICFCTDSLFRKMTSTFLPRLHFLNETFGKQNIVKVLKAFYFPIFT